MKHLRLKLALCLAATAFSTSLVKAEPAELVYQQEASLGGGLFEFIVNGKKSKETAKANPTYNVPQTEQQPTYNTAAISYTRNGQSALQSQTAPVEQEFELDPKYDRAIVEYSGKYKAGTIVIDTNTRYMYLVQKDGTAIRYGVGVGRPGFEWSGVKQISAKREWPDWRPPSQMLKRRPDLPAYMKGGIENPLGARAMYLGSSIYRIHGSNEPQTIGQAVSSGCIRMRNEDVVDLYDRVKVGTKVIVLQ
jgi:lipoprotein-anchoring transpeptidase ErfK/SrfK